MSRVARLLCLLAVLPIAGCYVPDYALRPQIVRADATGIVIISGRGNNPYNIAALHCQYYNKVMVPRGSELSGSYKVTYFYACE
ncbi:MAG: hypothetical protein KGL11_13690 [Alphaproteobacteria bacterium]|nr:hypothetical protein [Alphaproteobacteria bacterium]